MHLCVQKQGTSTLFTGSADRTVKIWSIGEMSYVDTLHGHGAEVLNVDCGRRERLLSVGRDRSCRVWKVPEDSQLVYSSGMRGIESCALITPTQWATGHDDGSISIWSQLKKKPAVTIQHAHAATAASNRNGAGIGASAMWVSALAACRNSDLIASGAGDGCVRLWAARTDVARRRGGNGDTNDDADGIEEEEDVHGDGGANGVERGARRGGGGGGRSGTFRSATPVGDIPVDGFVNALAVGASGRVLVAGLGQEPRWGRWARVKHAKNGVKVCRIESTSDGHTAL